MNLQGKVAIVTGGASGIGLAIAHALAERGAKLTLADIETERLETATHELRAAGHEVLGVRTDVSVSDSVDALVRSSVEHWGGLHVLCNNAGVNYLRGEPVWETPAEVWRWVMDVNFWGVVHGIRAAVPVMLERGEPAHIINTASIASYCTGGGLYGASKHAVASLTESLYLDLQARGAPIAVSLLLPGLIATNIVDSARNFPTAAARTDAQRQYEARLAEIHSTHGMAASVVGDHVARAIERGDRFYVITDEQLSPLIQQRVDRLAAGEMPRSWQTANK